MAWPWQRKRSTLRLSLAPAESGWAFVLSDHAAGPQPPRLLRWGVLPAGTRLPAAGETLALLPPPDYQILKVDTPNVPNDELKAAARWQIKDMVDAGAGELTLDVMHVGGDQPRQHRKLFVVAARSAAIQSLTQRAAATGAEVGVVDIWETALRNLLIQQARSDDLSQRACAAVLLHPEHAMLVVGAQDELFYTRRLEHDPGLLARAKGEQAAAEVQHMPLGFEYQPGGSFDIASAQDSPLVVELQRSIDVWERSWPDLPLARLYVVSADSAAEVATLVQRELGQRTVALNPLAAFGPETPAGEGAEALAACLPLLGLALRVETRQL
jgi:MSHA biogenesis protein MshI